VIRGIVGRWWSDQRTRRRIARVLVVIGAVLGIVGVFTARYGLLFAGIIIVGMAAGLGPARIRRRPDGESR
jgi:formate-dependent nitrite reductase membrane component NrfD